MIFQNLKTLHLVYRNYSKDFIKIKTKNDKTYFFMPPKKSSHKSKAKQIKSKKNKKEPKLKCPTPIHFKNSSSFFIQMLKIYLAYFLSSLFSFFVHKRICKSAYTNHGKRRIGVYLFIQ